VEGTRFKTGPCPAVTDSEGCRTQYVFLIGNIGKRDTTLNQGVVGVPGVVFPDCDDGHPCGSTVPVPARLEQFGHVGQWRVPGRRLAGLMSGYAVRVTQPLPSG
jgi:hypothetical protein